MVYVFTQPFLGTSAAYINFPIHIKKKLKCKSKKDITPPSRTLSIINAFTNLYQFLTIIKLNPCTQICLILILFNHSAAIPFTLGMLLKYYELKYTAVGPIS